MDVDMTTRSAILLSGGIDSAAIAYWKRPQYAITIDYGQLSAVGEIRAAAQIAKELGIQHEIISVDCRKLGSGDLAGMPSSEDAPAPEWWPFRNQLLVTLAAMRAHALKVGSLLVGSIKSDEFHVDGTERFYKCISDLVFMQEGSLKVETPAINLTAIDLVRQTEIPPGLLAWTHSCHKSDVACGHCRGCNKHRMLWRDLGSEGA